MRRIFLILVALGIVGAAAAWFISAPHPVFTAGEGAKWETGGDAGRGQLVFFAGGCASCHATPGQDDPLKLGGGLEMASPFGAFVAPNISPHPRDGIGGWKVVDLANAMLSGVSPDGGHYYPAFPYTSYKNVTVEDVRDLMFFLRTLPPVEGKAPPHRLPFPFTIRRGLGLWKALFFDPWLTAPPAGKGEEWLRGRYLVEGLGHCAECHSPRNALGAIIAARRFSGGPSPDGKGYVPNITPGEGGIGGWSRKDIVELLTTGFTPEYDSVGGEMAAVVRNMARLPASDREAIAEYLKSLAPLPGGRPTKK